MSVDVGDGLPGLRAGVEDDPVAALCDALGHSDLVSMGDEIGKQPVACGGQLSHIGMVVARDHEDMDGSLRINVPEGDRARITRNYGRRYLGSRNTAEQTVGHTGDLNVWQAEGAADIYGCPTANPRCTNPLVQRPPPIAGFPSPRDETCAGALGRHGWVLGGCERSRAGLTAGHGEDP